jgi:acyl-CoA-dependent ceramide synthase
MIQKHGHAKQYDDAQLCKRAAIDGLSSCAVPASVDNHPKLWQEMQQSCRPDRPTSPSSLGGELLEHQFGLCVNIIMVVLVSYYLFPELRDKTGGFFMLGYFLDGLYGIGLQDVKLISGFVVFFTAVRAASLDYILKPLAANLGIMKAKTQVRFAEQSYMIIYYTLFWSWGLTLFVHNTPGGIGGVEDLPMSLWSGYPQLRLNASFKLYYLSQLAFWIQQVAVLHLGHRRKDHLQMLMHHIVTIILLLGSYSYRRWRAGNAVLVYMDLVDMILPLAKVLRYLSLQRSCDAAFAVFVISWIATRHIFFLAICWSIYEHVHAQAMAYGTYSIVTGAMTSNEGGDQIFMNIFQPFLSPSSETVAFNANIRWLFLGLLLVLQCITIAWLIMILRVIMRMLRGDCAADARSDDEEEED